MTNQPPRYSRRLLPPIAELVAFDAAARTGSFTLAADELCLTQGAISRQILLLEEQLGVRLFERVRKRVVLTPAGSFYAEHVREALARLAAATAQTMASRGKGGILRLSVLPSFGTRWLIPRMPEFFARHPGISVNFISQLPANFDLARQAFDVAITFGTPHWPGTDVHQLMGEELIPVAAPGLVERLGVTTPARILDGTLLVHASQSDAWRDWFNQHGLDHAANRSTLLFEQFTMILPAAVAGLGIALVPAMLVEAELANHSLVRLFAPSVLTRPGQYHYLICPVQLRDHPPVAAFRDWLLMEVAGRGEAEDRHAR